MSRPLEPRMVRHELRHHRFKPAGIPTSDLATVVLTLDEAEAIALTDLEGLYQEAAARNLEVSRATYGRILSSARNKIADALLNGKLLLIEGGAVETCKKGKTKMKAAIAIHEDQIEDHFGQCRKIRLFDIVPGSTATTSQDFPLPADLGCRSGLAAVLARAGVTHVIAARMGGGVRKAFESHGMTVIGGVTGKADEAVRALALNVLIEGTVACEGHGDEAGHDHDHPDGGCCHN